MLLTLLTFPLRCSLDIERSGRGRLFTGPFANEAIMSVLAWLSGLAATVLNLSCCPRSLLDFITCYYYSWTGDCQG